MDGLLNMYCIPGLALLLHGLVDLHEASLISLLMSLGNANGNYSMVVYAFKRLIAKLNISEGIGIRSEYYFLFLNIFHSELC